MWKSQPVFPELKKNEKNVGKFTEKILTFLHCGFIMIKVLEEISKNTL